MSFILDALRKSELERQRQSGPIMAEFPVARGDRRLPWAAFAIGLLLALNVGVLLYFLLRNDPAPVAAVDAPAPATTVAVAPTAVQTDAASAQESATPATGMPASDAGASLPEATTSPPPAPDPTLLPVAPATPLAIYESGPAAELPAQATAGLPELAIDLHIFADDPARRAVFINGRRYQQGGVLIEGPTVEEITSEGAVLNYRGRRFLLPRL